MTKTATITRRNRLYVYVTNTPQEPYARNSMPEEKEGGWLTTPKGLLEEIRAAKAHGCYTWWRAWLPTGERVRVDPSEMQDLTEGWRNSISLEIIEDEE